MQTPNFGVQSGCNLLTSVQERSQIADDEGAFGLDHLAFQSVRFAIGQVFECQMLKTKQGCCVRK